MKLRFRHIPAATFLPSSCSALAQQYLLDVVGRGRDKSCGSRPFPSTTPNADLLLGGGARDGFRVLGDIPSTTREAGLPISRTMSNGCVPLAERSNGMQTDADI